ncbi:MAG TPA: hypothetical protein VL979_10450 [Solirubrobacteraceae bacterium]|nr:hypothetical protein [Solirubrobacteraceae bacterium]
MSALASAAAYAAGPEFLNSKGEAAKGVTFKATSGTGKLEGTVTIICSADTAEGEITGAKTVAKVVVTYTGCESSGKKCKSSGAASGEIKTSSLKGELGEVEKSEAESEVGEDLAPESGTTFTTVESCTPLGIKVSVTGSIIGEVLPIEKLATEGELVYKESSKKQQIKKFKGGSEDTLKAAGASSGLETTDKVKFSEAIEVDK